MAHGLVTMGCLGNKLRVLGTITMLISFNFHSFLTTLSISCGLLLFNQHIILVYILTKACLMPMYILSIMDLFMCQTFIGCVATFLINQGYIWVEWYRLN